jgi:hypothetical protein
MIRFSPRTEIHSWFLQEYGMNIAQSQTVSLAKRINIVNIIL